ncbi:MAG: hypothetical protein A3J70_07510 [Elusimicrobia bacterium RIFCSPHIGHO2_02_FULL_61_10]|nr:MAG: hypothetical protein A3J70_07510 [Elusimicrobia bacterium RIFCSPHIGHO2_02_FULL_61_10]
MKRITALKIVNLLIAVLALSQVTTGLLHDSLSKDAFEALHEAGGISFAAAALLHVVLNWSWVKANYFGGDAAA